MNQVRAVAFVMNLFAAMVSVGNLVEWREVRRRSTLASSKGMNGEAGSGEPSTTRDDQAMAQAC